MKTVGTALLAMVMSFVAGLAARDGRWERWIGISDAQAQSASQSAGCKLYTFQFAQAMEQKLSELYAQGAQVVTFLEDDKTTMPYVALVCKR